MAKKIMIGLVLTAAFLAAVLLYRNPPQQSRFYPQCIFKKATGYDCAGCGSARATHLLLHGNISGAADQNLLLITLLPLMIIGLIHFFTGRFKRYWLVLNKPVLLLAIILSFWLARNLPGMPFQWLHSGIYPGIH